MGSSQSASKGKIRHYKALYLFWIMSRRYKKVRKAQAKVIERHENLTYEQLKALEASGEDPPEVDYKEELEAIALPAHEFGSSTYLAFALKQKALWVKIAQAVATRHDLAPEPYTRKLKKCQDEMPATAWKIVQREIERELKKPIDVLFNDFEQECLGSASIAQVHRGTMSSGQKVVVKVQHVGVRELFLQDLKTFQWVLKKMADSFGDEFDYGFLFEAWKEAIPAELDFRTEAQNLLICDFNLKSTQTAEYDKSEHPLGLKGGPATLDTLKVGSRIEANYKKSGLGLNWYKGKIAAVYDRPDGNKTFDVVYDDDDTEEGVALALIRFPEASTYVDVIIPKPVPELVTSCVLGMSFEEGILLNNMQGLQDYGVTAADKKVLLFSVAKAYGKMIFVDGFFQADPHPGNILIQKQPNGNFKPVLLDFGLAEHIPDHMRFGLAKIFTAATKLSREMFVEGFGQLGPDLDRMRQYEVGDKIEAIWASPGQIEKGTNSGDWYAGVMMGVHGDGTFTVKFDDDGTSQKVRGRDLTKQGRPDMVKEFMKALTRSSETKDEVKKRKADFQKMRNLDKRRDAARTTRSKTDKAERAAWKAERKRNREKLSAVAGTFQTLPKEWIFFGRVLGILRATATQHDIKVDMRAAFGPFCTIALEEEEEIVRKCESSGGVVSSAKNPRYKSREVVDLKLEGINGSSSGGNGNGNGNGNGTPQAGS